MKVVLSPAKAIDTTKKLNSTEFSSPVFIKEAEDLIKKIKKLNAKKIGQLMHLSNDLAELNYQRFQDWSNETTLNEINAPVAAAFNGEVYRGFDAPSFTKDELTIAQEKVRILSGLYGILKPLDVIYPYRLEMGTKWAYTPAKPNLYKYWGSKIAEALNEEMQKEDTLVNLASAEYFKAIDTKKLKARVITPLFKEFKNGDYKVVMVYAKQARGMMARYIVKNNIADPEDLKSFNEERYRFDENLSSENEWVFTR